MNQRSVMTHQFSQVPAVEIPRSSFDRSHGHKTTFDAGLLVPIYVDEALPGDTFNMNMTGFARLATPIFPIMDNMFMETFFFAVPLRLVWDNWEKFNGQQRDPGDSTDFLVPILDPPAQGFAIESLPDYMGIPHGISDIVVNALHFRAYNLIWNDWFRDENLQDSKDVQKGDGPDNLNQYAVWRRGKRHDYFTSALPFPQKGDPVSVLISGDAEVQRINSLAEPTFADADALGHTLNASNASTDLDIQPTTGPAGGGPMTWLNPGLKTNFDINSSAGIEINDMRQAFQVQRLLERDARGGTRYTEIIRSHFGVTSADQRLQRPEYLGGGSTPINITPVAQTSATGIDEDTNSPQANLSAFGTASLHNHGFTKSFTEHCVIIGLVNVRADLTYQQGLNRMWSRATRFDFFWPALSHLGEQSILNKEIHMVGTAADEQVFGYQERYAEYRYKPSQITGKFRSTSETGLDAWHLSQDFVSVPVLGETFIEDNPPIDRVIAVPGEPHFLFDSYFNLRCARPMPLYGVPGMIDHF